MKVQVKIGSEWHTTERRSAMVKINGNPIYKVLKPVEPPEWESIGHKGAHGKWCTAIYDVPAGSLIEFFADANGKPPINASFKVGETSGIDVDGYTYGNRLCGWIVSV